MVKSCKFVCAALFLSVFMIGGICRVALADAASPGKWHDLRWVAEKYFKDKNSSNYEVRYDYYSKASKKITTFEEYKKNISSEPKNVTAVVKVVDILDTDNPIYKIVFSDNGYEFTWILEDHKWKLVGGLGRYNGSEKFYAGNLAEALPLLIKVNEIIPYNSNIKFLLSNTYRLSKGIPDNSELALQYAKEALACLKYTKIKYTSLNVFFNLGLIYRQLNNKDLEKKYLKMALDTYPEIFAANYFYAASLGKKCDYPNYEKDLKVLKADFKETPKNPLILDLFDKDPAFKKIVLGM